MTSATRSRRRIAPMLLLVSITVLAACGGFRRGWESVASLEPAAGAVPPAPADSGPRPGHAGRLRLHPTFDLPGARLGVTVDNTLRTNDLHLYLFVLPLYWDPKDVFTHTHQRGQTRVFVRMTPTVPGWVFRPTRATLWVAGQAAVAAGGHDAGAIDGIWRRRPVPDSLVLAEAGRTYELSLDFAVPSVSPRDTAFAIDLAEALVPPPGVPRLPRVRFRGVRWREGYS